MRKYNVSDVFTVIDILSAIDIGGIKNIFTAEGVGGNGNGNSKGKGDNSLFANTASDADARGAEVVVYLLNTMYAKRKNRLIDWFASLQEKTREEFLNAPPELVIDTIQEIATGEESKDFFSRVSAAFKRINASGIATPKK